MRVSAAWERRQEDELRAALLEAERLLADLTGPCRKEAIAALAVAAKHLYGAAVALNEYQKGGVTPRK